MHAFILSLKAYCGFQPTCAGEPDIATGKWGCGAFNGDPQLKGNLLQCETEPVPPHKTSVIINK